MASWLIPVGLLVLALVLLSLRLVWQILWPSDPSEYERQKAEVRAAAYEMEKALGQALEPALRRVVAAVEKIAERL